MAGPVILLDIPGSILAYFTNGFDTDAGFLVCGECQLDALAS